MCFKLQNRVNAKALFKLKRLLRALTQQQQQALQTRLELTLPNMSILRRKHSANKGERVLSEMTPSVPNILSLSRDRIGRLRLL